MRLKNKEFMIALAQKQMNCTELANASGISRATISYIKNGKSCKADVAGKIADALDIDVTEIFDIK